MNSRQCTPSCKRKLPARIVLCIIVVSINVHRLHTNSNFILVYTMHTRRSQSMDIREMFKQQPSKKPPPPTAAKGVSFFCRVVFGLRVITVRVGVGCARRQIRSYVYQSLQRVAPNLTTTTPQHTRNFVEYLHEMCVFFFPF